MRLIDADALTQSMYQEAFESDSDRQRWDSGCWIRYKLFEDHMDAQPTIDAVPVVMIESRINGLKKMLIDIDSDDVDNIWALRTEIDTLTELLEMWAERKEK